MTPSRPTYVLNPSLATKLSLGWRQRGHERQDVVVEPRKRPRLARMILDLLAVADRPTALRRLVEAHGTVLSDLGLVVPKGARPDEVPADPTLDPLLLELVPAAARARFAEQRRRRPHELTFASGLALLQRGPARPNTTIPGIPSAKHFPRGKDLLWVHDPGTQMWSFYRVTPGDLAVIRALAAGRRVPADLDPTLAEILVHAGVVTTPRWRRERERAWADCAARARRTARDGWAVARAVLPPLVLATLRRRSRDLHREGYFYCDELHVPARRRDYCSKDPLTGFVHRQAGQLVRTLTRASVFPSWSLLSRYQSGARLTRHTDRDQCAWNASVAVDSESADSGATSPWPLYLEIDGRVERVDLELGDLALYQGTRHPHWRRALGKGRTDTMMLWFYVPVDFQGDTLE